MRVVTRARIAAILLVAAVGAGFTSCGKTEKKVAEEETTTTSTTSTTAAKPVAKPGTCDPALLKQAAAAKVPDAQVKHEVCASTTAIATVIGTGTAPSGDAGFFETDSNGTWQLKVTAPVADVEKSAPQGFPATLIAQWKDKATGPAATPRTTLCLFYNPSEPSGCSDQPYTGPGSNTGGGN
jgi:hypothetical protein